jgi:hypothetical protein
VRPGLLPTSPSSKPSGPRHPLGAQPFPPGVVVDLSYIAGFFDGEGCVRFSEDRRRPHRAPSYCLRVALAQKKRRVLDQVVEFLGCGSVYYLGKSGGHQANWSSDSAAKVLRALLPYLTCKREEAEIALAAQEARSTHRGWAYHALRFIKNPDYVPTPTTTPTKTMKMSPPPTRHPLTQELVGCGPDHS